MLVRLVPLLAAMLAPLAAAETTTTTTTTTTTPASAPPREDHRPSVEVGSSGVRLRVCDIRLSVGGQHGPTRVHDDYTSGAGSQNPTGGYDYQVKRHQNGGGIVDVGFIYGRIHDWGGLLWGAGLRSTSHTLDLQGTSTIPETQDLRYGTFGLIGHVDYGYAFTHSWHAEIGPFASVGGASMDWFDQDATGTYRQDTASGGYIQGGLRAGTYLALWRHFVLGFNLEYSGTLARMSVDHSASSGKSDITVHEHGLGGLVSAGFRF